MNIILPSLLASPSLTLGKSIAAFIEQGLCDFHVDIMDYHFTQNFGLSIHHIEEIQASFPSSKLDVHLMTKPTRRVLIEKLIQLGIQDISVHWNTLSPQDQQWILKQDLELRIAINPDEKIPHNLPTSRVLILCVNPGFSHQDFQPKVLEKIKEAKQLGLNVTVDGGINQNNITDIIQHRPDHLVIGSGLIKIAPSEQLQLIKKVQDHYNSRS